MDLYEYQGKSLLRSVGIATPEGRVATSPPRAAAAAQELGGRVVVKAQVLTGGRGKAGGIALADDGGGAEAAARRILGMDINGHVVHRVLVEEASHVERELYASLVFDRGAKKTLAMLSGTGGMEIEEVAAADPEAVARVHVDPLVGWSDYIGRRLLFEAGLGPELQRHICDLFAKLYDAYTRYDAMLVEVNPLLVTSENHLVALDCKFTVDNNALYRHPDIAAMADHLAADPQEVMAHERGVTYVKLDGDIGVLGNGAGLVMSTLDVVAAAGGRPANFLDVGGGAKADEIVTALEVITSDPKVRVILFNIFGGITRCDEVARGMLAAIDQMGIGLPIVVRLDGTNEAEGRAIIAKAVGEGAAGLHVEATMLGAARRAVELARSAGDTGGDEPAAGASPYTGGGAGGGA